jgi:hypothetical protein
VKKEHFVWYFIGGMGWIEGRISNDWSGLAWFLLGFALYDLIAWGLKAVKR